RTLPSAMRFLSWIGAVLVVATLAVGVGTAAHPRSASGHNLTASRQPASLFSGSDPVAPDPPHKIVPPSPSPDPPPPPPVAAPAPPARAAIVVGSTQQALINQDRAAYGLGPLTWNSCLYNVAVSNARRIAAQGSLSHTNGPSVDLTCGLGRQAGENVGWWSGGINDGKINGLFMASPEHKANIL